MRKTLVPILFLALLAFPAAAQQTTDTDKRIQDLEKQVQELQKQQKATAKTATATAPAEEKAAAPAKKSKGLELKTVTDKGQLSWETADGAYKFRLCGRVQFDGAFFNGSENRLANGVTIRRGRIGYKATIAKDWVSEFDVDFAENAVDIKDAFIGYKGFENVTIQAGNFKEPFGYDTLTSSKDIWFVERSYSDAWTPDRRLGGGVYYGTDRWEAAATFFGQAISVDSTGVDQGWGWAARVTGAPIMQASNKAIHIGFAADWRKPDAATTGASGMAPIVYQTDFSSRPESTKVNKAKFLNSGTFSQVDWTQQYGAEFVGVWGPFAWQSEYQWTTVTRLPGNPTLVDHTFTAWYAQAAFVLNGTRKYDASEGLMKRVEPTGKWGAVEFLARYSTMDLNDITTIDPIKGGSAKNITLGVNWYPNYNFRVMLNYTWVNNDQYAKPKSAYGGITNDDFQELQFRIQFAF
jgi:phosphate-selective porin OprO and OprP